MRSPSDETINIVGFAVPEAANKAIAEEWAKTARGRGRRRSRPPTAPRATRAGPSVDGLEADYVHFSVASDVTRLVDAGPRRRRLERRPDQGHRVRARSWCSPSARATPRTSRTGTT